MADATNDFRIVSNDLVDGKPKVEWEPKVNRASGGRALPSGRKRRERVPAAYSSMTAVTGKWSEG